MRNAVIFFTLVLLITACKARKTQAVAESPVQMGNLKMDTAVMLKGDNINRKSWQYFSGRLAIDYNSADGQEISGTLSLRMRNDSLLWFSVSAIMGIQVAKGIITRDSVIVLDLYHKEYMRLGIDDLSNMLGAKVSLRQLQNLIIANPLFDTLYYQKDTSSGGWFLAKDPITNLLFTNNTGNIDSTIVAETLKSRQIKAVYSGDLKAGSYSVPEQMKLTAFGDKNTVRLQVAFTNPSDAFIPSYPFSIPAGYTRKQ